MYFGWGAPGRMQAGREEQASRPLQKRLQGPRRLIMCLHAQYLRADKNQFDGDSLDMGSLECTLVVSRLGGCRLDVRDGVTPLAKKPARVAPLGHSVQTPCLLQVSPSAPS